MSSAAVAASLMGYSFCYTLFVSSVMYLNDLHDLLMLSVLYETLQSLVCQKLMSTKLSHFKLSLTCGFHKYFPLHNDFLM